MKIVLTVLTTGLLFAAGSAGAQDVLTPHSGASALELHRLDMARMRIEADVRAAEHREQTLTTRLNRLEIQSRRQPALAPAPLTTQGYVSPEAERLRREAATAARIEVQGASGEIDQWLDRAPPR